MLRTVHATPSFCRINRGLFHLDQLKVGKEKEGNRRTEQSPRLQASDMVWNDSCCICSGR